MISVVVPIYNTGPSLARNRGPESSQGEWVVFVDSDDAISPDLLSMIAEEQSADLLIVDFTFTGQRAAGAAGGAQRISVPLDSGSDRADLIERLLRFWPLAKGGHTALRAPWAKAFRRSLLERAYAANTLKNMAFLLIKGIFNPYSPNTARENRELCRRMRADEIYTAALKYNYKIGIPPRRILLGFFQLRCYLAVKIICRMCFFLLERIDRRRAVCD